MNGINLKLVGTLVASKHVLWEELEHYNYGKNTVGIIEPIVVLAFCEPFEVESKLDLDLFAIRATPAPDMALFLKNVRLWWIT